MAACIDPKLGEYHQVATAAGPSKSAAEVDVSWANHVDHSEQPRFDRSKRERDRLATCPDNDDNVDCPDCRNGRSRHEKKSCSRSSCTGTCSVQVGADVNVNRDTMDASETRDNCEIIGHEGNGNGNRIDRRVHMSEGALSNRRRIEERGKLLGRNCTSEIILADAECRDARETRAIRRAIRVPIAAANDHHVNNPAESASYSSQGADKAIGGSRKCGRSGHIDSRKDDCDEVEPMEIDNSPRSRAYSRGNDVVESAASTTAHRREALWGEASRKIGDANADARSPGRTRVNADGSACSADRADSASVIARYAPERQKRTDATRRCDNCGRSHSPHDRHSPRATRRQQPPPDYPNRGDAVPDPRIDAVDRDPPIGGRPMAAAMMLHRSRSLPRLSIHDSGVACSDHVPAPPGHTHAPASRQLVADLRQLLTLKQHYYPEGGWGWVILLVGLLVQILSHGAHGSVGVFLEHVAAKFGPRVYLQAG